MTFIIAAGLVLGIVWLLRKLLRDTKNLAQQWKTFALLALMVLSLLVVTKKLHVLGLLAAGLIPIFRQLAPLLVRFGPSLHQQFQRYRFQKDSAVPPVAPGKDPNGQPADHNTGSASVTTALFHMVLDPNTGQITGTVRQGPYQGQSLAALTLADLQQLHEIARTHADDSLAVYEAYLHARLGEDWQAQIYEDLGAYHPKAPTDGAITEAEAWAILGLTPDSGRTEIVARHKSLIQKLHPDRGGSNYLAVRINQARDLLLKKVA